MYNNDNNGHCTLKTIAWDSIYRSESEGGLGIRKTQDINTAHLAMKGWKILTQPDNSWVQLVRQK